MFDELVKYNRLRVLYDKSKKRKENNIKLNMMIQ